MRIIKIVDGGDKRAMFLLNLPQGGMEIPAKFDFKTENIELYKQMKEIILELIEKFEEREKLQSIKVWESKKILFFPLI